MAGRTHIPGSPACGQWETLLTDALDGLLKPEDEAVFAAHMAACPACAALFDQASKGREWLKFLSPGPEIPAGLLDKILARTGPGKTAPHGLAAGSGSALPVPQGLVPGFVPAWQRPGFFGFVRRFAEPRLVMTAAMAFFSIALTLNLTGVRLRSLRLSDLRPAVVRAYMERQLNTASIPIIRYCDNLRFVDEIESRMREMRGAAEGESRNREYQQPNQSQPAAPGESRQNPGRDDGGSRAHPPQLSCSLALSPASGAPTDFVETSLKFENRSAHSGGSSLQRPSAVVGGPGSAMAFGKRAQYGLRKS